MYIKYRPSHPFLVIPYTWMEKVLHDFNDLESIQYIILYIICLIFHILNLSACYDPPCCCSSHPNSQTFVPLHGPADEILFFLLARFASVVTSLALLGSRSQKRWSACLHKSFGNVMATSRQRPNKAFLWQFKRQVQRPWRWNVEVLRVHHVDASAGINISSAVPGDLASSSEATNLKLSLRPPL